METNIVETKHFHEGMASCDNDLLVTIDPQQQHLYFTIHNNYATLARPPYDAYPYAYDVVVPEAIVFDGVKYPVTHIDSAAFSLYSIYRGTNIMDYGFWEMDTQSHIRSVDLPNTITHIGHNAFAICRNLEWVHIPASVQYIGENIFVGCKAEIRNESSCIYVDERQCIYNGDRTHLIHMPNTIDGEYVILPTTTHIEQYACFDCINIDRIVIPDSMQCIGTQAFFNCYQLKEVDMPNSVTELGYNIWGECVNLKRVRLSESLNKLPISLFAGCKSLKELHLPDGIMVIGNKAFEGCSALKSVNCPAELVKLGYGVFCGSKVKDKPFVMKVQDAD